MTSVPSVLPPVKLKPLCVSADSYTAWVDGVVQSIALHFDRGDASVGIRPSVEVQFLGAPSMDSRADWDEAHPGVEPTPEAMRALMEAAGDAINDDVQEAFAKQEEPEPDFDEEPMVDGRDW
jgi:hypothetical protein